MKFRVILRYLFFTLLYAEVRINIIFEPIVLSLQQF